MNNKTVLEKTTEYVQSANSLFNFMQEESFLIKAIDKKALFPRYCKENIEYMHIKNPKGENINQIAVLQKCFCDIPLHKINEKFYVEFDDSQKNEGTKIQEKFNSHTKCYGEYAIAFSKGWCIKKGLQPISYINDKADYLRQFKETYTKIISKMEEESIDNILYQLALFKPLQGKMSRPENGNELFFIKNFHDEKEWRYIPDENILRKKRLNKIIFIENAIKQIDKINTNIESDSYKEIWLEFDYSDIKYLIVPDDASKKRIIEYIIKQPLIQSEEKYELISKLLVLSDIRKDW